MKRALIVLADGFEEIEAVTPIDLLRRAGVDVLVAGLNPTAVSKRGLRITCDTVLAEASRDWDAIVLPGGRPGADHLAANAELQKLLKWADTAGKLIAAICAAPAVVLGPQGLLKGRRYTGFPGTESPVFEGIHSTQAVVRDGSLLTSRGAGTASAFSFALIAALVDQATADRVADETLFQRG